MADYGKLLVNVTTDDSRFPIQNARVSIYVNQSMNAGALISQPPIIELLTDESGQTTIIELETPPLSFSENPEEPRPYSNYVVEVKADGYETVVIYGVELFPDVTAIQNVRMTSVLENSFPTIMEENGLAQESNLRLEWPESVSEQLVPVPGPSESVPEPNESNLEQFEPAAEPSEQNPEQSGSTIPDLSTLPIEIIDIPPHTLYGDYPPKIPESEIKPISETGEIVLSRVVIPEYIIVHDGIPSNSSAKNYYVKYKDYIKNVVSCEIYSTWPESTIYANTLVIMSFTLNRVYTEWYRNRGYNFTITSSTAYDQKWVYGKTIYKNISNIVDTIFNNYVSRPGVKQPLFTSYCDGSKTSCRGLSQWGSKYLGEQGYSALGILRYYYGNDVYINSADSISGVPSSWPGYNLTIGSRGQKVMQLQSQLNRIGRNYPAIKRISEDGIYGAKTAEAVRTFQRVFSLPVSGVTDFATWYEISNVYVAVAGLSEP